MAQQDDSALNELPSNAPPGYILNLEEERFEFDSAYQMLRAQHDQIEKVDNKLASLVAGSSAAMYFFLDKASGTADNIAAALFSIPLVMAMLAYRTYAWYDVGPAAFVEYFGTAPRETRLSTIKDIVTCYNNNFEPLNKKGISFDRALVLAICISILGVLVKLVESYFQAPKP